MHLVKPSGNQKEQETKQSHFHQSDVMDDAVKVERGELIARKDHTAPKHSCSYVKEDDYSSVNMSKQFFVQLACMLMVISNVIKSVTSLNSLNLKKGNWTRHFGMCWLGMLRPRCLAPYSPPIRFWRETFVCL